MSDDGEVREVSLADLIRGVLKIRMETEGGLLDFFYGAKSESVTVHAHDGALLIRPEAANAAELRVEDYFPKSRSHLVQRTRVEPDVSSGTGYTSGPAVKIEDAEELGPDARALLEVLEAALDEGGEMSVGLIDSADLEEPELANGETWSWTTESGPVDLSALADNAEDSPASYDPGPDLDWTTGGG